MKLIAKLTLGIFLVGSASAATINVGAGFGTAGIVPTMNGLTLAPGTFYFQAGTYTTVPTVSDSASLISAVNSLVAYGNAVNPSGLTASKLAGSFTDNTAGQSDKIIYFVVGNGTTRANSNAFSIFSMTANNRTPADNTQSVAVPITISAFNQISPLSGAGTTRDTTIDELALVPTSAIPEPSALLLGALGVIGFLRRRRN